MKRSTLTVLTVLLCTLGLCLKDAITQPAVHPPEIHCKHFVYGYPLGAPASNDLIIRDLYALRNCV